MTEGTTRAGADLVDRIAYGFRDAQVLLTANRLGLFDAVGEGARSAEELAEALGADRRGVRILCDALAALGLLEKEHGRYRNGAAAREALLSSSPHNRRAILAHASRLYERWARLDDAVREGRPVPDEAIDPRLASGAESFAHAMADVGRQSARTTFDALELGGVRRALDLGGGPGLYAIELARRQPDLEVTLLDGAETLEVARQNIEAAGVGDRVRLLPGDAFTIELGGPYDLVFASNFVHIFPAAANRTLVARCAAALAPGGRLALKDFFLDAERTSPVGGALFAVNMLVATEGGDGYTVAEVENWLRSAGLQPVARTDLTPRSRLIVGRKGSVGEPPAAGGAG